MQGTDIIRPICTVLSRPTNSIALGIDFFSQLSHPVSVLVDMFVFQVTFLFIFFLVNPVPVNADSIRPTRLFVNSTAFPRAVLFEIGDLFWNGFL